MFKIHCHKYLLKHYHGKLIIYIWILHIFCFYPIDTPLKLIISEAAISSILYYLKTKSNEASR